MRVNPPELWAIACAWKAWQANPEKKRLEDFGELLVEKYGMDCLSWMLTSCFDDLGHIPAEDLKEAWGAYTLKRNKELIS